MMHEPQTAARHTWSDVGGLAFHPILGLYGHRDEMAVIASDDNGFGYRPDDHGHTVTTASPLTPPAEEFLKGRLTGAGIIGSTDDVDGFYFTTGGGEVSVQVNPPSGVGNLDATLKLYNSAGALIAESNDPNVLTAKVTAQLAAGTYLIHVGSAGVYGDVGQYSLFVTEGQGARIVQSEYQWVNATRAVIQVTFDEPINPLTFTADDVRFGGAALGAGVLNIYEVGSDSRKFSILVNKPTMTGANWSVTVGPHIEDMFGNEMDQDRNGLKGEAHDVILLSLLADGLGTNAPESGPSQDLRTIRWSPNLLDNVFQQIK
jgi:hypothetical protein